VKRVLLLAMDLRFTPEQEAFRSRARAWLESQLSGRFARLRGRGGPGDEHSELEGRQEFEQAMGEEGWACLSWSPEFGGQGATLLEQVIFYEEYARARAPGRLGHIGEGLIGPTIIALGTQEQKTRFLPPIVNCKELWCQGYSEPNAGSDLANVQTKAVLEGDEWVIHGQKIWTSLAHWSDWCFVLCRTDTQAPRHRGISYLLVPMKQAGIETRPIQQMTGSSEFNEVFFEGARTSKDNVIGEVNGGWKVAMATLAFERGASTLGQQLSFQNELEEVIALAKKNGKTKDLVFRQKLAKLWSGLQIMRLNALRMLSGMQGEQLGKDAMISKLYWSHWHRDLGELAMEVLGPEAELALPGTYELTPLQRLFLFTRSDTIYAGSSQIQRNIIGERALGLPPEPKAR
jgi:alkylation response protein AidB-like acyl-CoA dehydrogenase